MIIMIHIIKTSITEMTITTTQTTMDLIRWAIQTIMDLIRWAGLAVTATIMVVVS